MSFTYGKGCVNYGYKENDFYSGRNLRGGSWGLRKDSKEANPIAPNGATIANTLTASIFNLTPNSSSSFFFKSFNFALESELGDSFKWR